MALLLLASLVAILTTLGIFVTLVFETVRFFGMVSPVDFLFGTHWGPDPMSSAGHTRSGSATARCRCSGGRSTSARSSRCSSRSRSG